MRVAVISTKGGTGKTTTSIYLALALHRAGRTLLADCDPQSSALSWSQPSGTAVLPYSVVSLPTRTVAKTIADVGSGYDHVVLDTPPGDLGIITSAVMAAELAVVPVSPTGLDMNRLQPTFEMLANLETMHPIDVGVLLTKVRRGTRSARDAREVLNEMGYPVLDTEIPLAEMYAGAFGSAPADLGSYDALLAELKG